MKLMTKLESLPGMSCLYESYLWLLEDPNRAFRVRLLLVFTGLFGCVLVLENPCVVALLICWSNDVGHRYLAAVPCSIIYI